MKKNHTNDTATLIEIASSIVKNKILQKEYSDDVLREIIYNNIRNIGHIDREKVAEDMIEKLSVILKKQNINSQNLTTSFSEEKINRHVEELNNDGITLLGEVLSPAQVSDIQNYLKNRPVFNGHVWSAGDKKEYELNDLKEKFPQGNYRLQDTLQAPYLLEFMCDPNITKIAEKYLGAVPKLYSTNLMWSSGKHHNPKKGVARMFHRDTDNFNFCVLFILLTDVKKGSGSHQYLKKTHKTEAIQELLLSLKKELNSSDYNSAVEYLNSSKLGEGYVNDEVLPTRKVEELFKSNMLEVEGKAGSAFIADVYGLHRGVPVISDDRLLFWGRFALFDNGFSSDLSSHKADWSDVKNRIDQTSYNEYLLSSIVSKNKEDSELHSPVTKRLKENILVGNSEEIAAALLKNDGTKKYVRNFFSSIINRKKMRLTK
jgi:hypothetical protein